jgi:hypothetical protein
MSNCVESMARFRSRTHEGRGLPLRAPRFHDVTYRTCQRRCVLLEKQTEWYRIRKKEGGKLCALICGEVSVCSVNPIEERLFIISILVQGGCRFFFLKQLYCRNRKILCRFKKYPLPVGGRYEYGTKASQFVLRGCD